MAIERSERSGAIHDALKSADESLDSLEDAGREISHYAKWYGGDTEDREYKELVKQMKVAWEAVGQARETIRILAHRASLEDRRNRVQ